MPLREPIAPDRPIARAKKLMFVACFLRISAESLYKTQAFGIILYNGFYGLLIAKRMNRQSPR